MDNKDVSAAFAEMADLLEISGGDAHRIRAFRRIARVLDALAEPLAELLKYQRLEQLPGIGEGAIARIKEILRSGTCTDLRQLRATLPAGLRDVAEIEGIGPKTVRLLYAHLRIGSVDELEIAARSGRIARIPQLGERTQERALRGIEVFRKRIGRVLLADAIVRGMEIVEELRGHPAVIQCDLAGSARRRKETVRDLDVLVATHDSVPIVSAFAQLPGVSEVIVQGTSRCSVRLDTRQQVDLRLLPPESYGAGLHYFTGAQQHNIYLRARGNRMGLKISEHGVFSRRDESHRLLPGETESEIFRAVGLPFIPPELRENTGEIEAAAKGTLPVLVEEVQILGDLHLHTKSSIGTDSARAMVEEARRLGLRYVAITDRAQDLTPRLAAQTAHLRALERETGVRVAAGIEVAIGPAGELECDASILRDRDFVVASLQDHLDLPRAEMTGRVLRAMETGLVDLIAHPSGRLIGERSAWTIDMERVLKAALRMGVAVELHSGPRRLDLDSAGCRRARELGVSIAICSGAGRAAEMSRRRFGVYAARRGWLEAKDVLTAQPWAIVEERRRDRLRKVQGGGNAKSAVQSDATKRARETSRLKSALAKRPLGEKLRVRLEHYFHGTPDPALEAALLALSENPIQKAFEILFQC